MLTSSEGGLNTSNRLQTTDYFECKRPGYDHADWMVEMEQAATVPKDISFAGDCRQNSKGGQWYCSRNQGHPGDHMALYPDAECIVAIWSQDGDIQALPTEAKVAKYTINDRYEYPRVDADKLPVWPGQYNDAEGLCEEKSPMMNFACTAGYKHGGPHLFRPGSTKEEKDTAPVYAIWDTVTDND